ncbi:MAG: hypothetical protein QOH52_1281, partial [Pseudonocardiales bacterium]|nr:hypothetical protein [Pseudonocardiales bacterium]
MGEPARRECVADDVDGTIVAARRDPGGQRVGAA